MDALLGGVLQGRSTSRAACFWIGSGADRQAIVWPHGFSAADDPLRIVGPDGQDLAAVGSAVELGGGVLPGYHPTSEQDPCGIGALAIVSSIATVDGRSVEIGEGSLRIVTRPVAAIPSCPAEPIGSAMLVMVDGRLRVRLDGLDLNATWPAGSVVRPGSRISVLAADGSTLAVQGVERETLRGIRSAAGIDLCGDSDVVFP